jgi:hypothetical protein
MNTGAQDAQALRDLRGFALPFSNLALYGLGRRFRVRKITPLSKGIAANGHGDGVCNEFLHGAGISCSAVPTCRFDGDNSCYCGGFHPISGRDTLGRSLGENRRHTSCWLAALRARNKPPHSGSLVSLIAASRTRIWQRRGSQQNSVSRPGFISGSADRGRRDAGARIDDASTLSKYSRCLPERSN